MRQLLLFFLTKASMRQLLLVLNMRYLRLSNDSGQRRDLVGLITNESRSKKIVCLNRRDQRNLSSSNIKSSKTNTSV